jgi:hypothetical protein
LNLSHGSSNFLFLFPCKVRNHGAAHYPWRSIPHDRISRKYHLLDYYRKDLLLHEAHRHPYVERLGALCLLKLNRGDAFGTRGGSAWRLLYVLSLMPWLKKYRANARKMMSTDAMRASRRMDQDDEDFAKALSDSELGPDSVPFVDDSIKPLKKNKKKRSIVKGPPMSAYDCTDFIEEQKP